MATNIDMRNKDVLYVSNSVSVEVHKSYDAYELRQPDRQ